MEFGQMQIGWLLNKKYYVTLFIGIVDKLLQYFRVKAWLGYQKRPSLLISSEPLHLNMCNLMAYSCIGSFIFFIEILFY
jgi:hypothetical protein